MNIARLPKADDRSGFFKAVTESLAVWQVAEPQRPESTFLQHQSPTVSAQLKVKNLHRKSPTEGVLWVDMITNALIVIIMALASYVSYLRKLSELISSRRSFRTLSHHSRANSHLPQRPTNAIP